MLLFLMCILVGVLAHHAAILVTGYLAVSHDQFEDFVSGMLNLVYMGLAIVILMHVIFGGAAFLFTAFATALFFTMARVDLEATHDIMQQNDD